MLNNIFHVNLICICTYTVRIQIEIHIKYISISYIALFTYTAILNTFCMSCFSWLWDFINIFLARIWNSLYKEKPPQIFLYANNILLYRYASQFQRKTCAHILVSHFDESAIHIRKAPKYTPRTVDQHIRCERVDRKTKRNVVRPLPYAGEHAAAYTFYLIIFVLVSIFHTQTACQNVWGILPITSSAAGQQSQPHQYAFSFA